MTRNIAPGRRRPPSPMQRDPDKAADALRHDCPKLTCKAEGATHRPCVNLDGRPMEWPHAMRYGAARTAHL